MDCFYRLYVGGYVTLEYDIVQMDKLDKLPNDNRARPVSAT